MTRALALRPALHALVLRAARCAYIRWRIREAEKDHHRLVQQIEHDRQQLATYTAAIEAMRVLHAQVESGTA